MNRFPAASALLLALTLPLAARADDASLHAKAEELIALQHTDKSVAHVAETITQEVDDAADRAAGPDATADQKAKVDNFKKTAAQSIDARLGWPAMKQDIVDLYAKAFTEDQLDQILAFYKTPAGAALLDKLPAINAQFGQLGNQRVAELRGELQKSYQDLMNNLRPVPTLGPVGPAPAAPSSSPATPGTGK